MAASCVGGIDGPLRKWTNVLKGWQYRWGAAVGINDEDGSTFTIRVDHKTFLFQARDAEERERWVHALEDTILRHTLQQQPNAEAP
ncbi:hypothetical protein MTO96_028015 [Rhipicephalus appendiculatus]